ncbi:MAG: hypothetical protein K2M96_09615 [Prevotella sp.]|nr:hypothetical protein [Prevotella sp.]
MKRLLFILLLSVISYALIAQTGPSKKCPTCGLSVPKCKYKGKHPNPAPPPKTPAKPAPSKPVAQQSISVKPSHPTTGIINGHGWVDLGLSVKWATCNVGASSPSDYGDYYAWGEIRPNKSRYDWDNCFDCLDSEGNSWGVYKVGGQKQISPTSGHDTARENWGGSWRMPTYAENEELCKKCKWRWTSRDGHNGYVVTGPNGNSIFLPAAGFRISTDLLGVGEGGFYWSGSLVSSDSGDVRSLEFSSGGHYTDDSLRCFGKSVRPVTE